MTTTRTAATILAAGAVLLAGCTGEPAPAPSPSPTTSATAPAENDPDREALTAAVADLEATLAALRGALETAAAGDAGGLRDAVTLLVAEPDTVLSTAVVTDGPGAAPDDDGADGSTTQPQEPDATDPGTTDDDATGTTSDPGNSAVDGLAPILPGPLTSREESIQYGDLLTRMLGAARGAGSAGEPALRFLADPLAGDLGAWQRAPADQLDAIARAGTAPDLAATETAILDLTGEAPRAAAWVVHGLTVPADAEDAAGRALAHLAIIDLTLDQLT